MLSWARAAGAATPKLDANASPRTMCVRRIASSSCFHPAPAAEASGISSRSPALGAGSRICKDFAPLIGEWPHPQLLFSDLPQPGEAARLDGEEEDDEGTDNHELQVLDRRRAN